MKKKQIKSKKETKNKGHQCAGCVTRIWWNVSMRKIRRSLMLIKSKTIEEKKRRKNAAEVAVQTFTPPICMKIHAGDSCDFIFNKNNKNKQPQKQK